LLDFSLEVGLFTLKVESEVFALDLLLVHDFVEWEQFLRIRLLVDQLLTLVENGHHLSLAVNELADALFVLNTFLFCVFGCDDSFLFHLLSVVSLFNLAIVKLVVDEIHLSLAFVVELLSELIQVALVFFTHLTHQILRIDLGMILLLAFTLASLVSGLLVLQLAVNHFEAVDRLLVLG